jgi:hypothetical protein
MCVKISIYLILLGSAIGLPAHALAQTQQPSADNWYGPGFMLGGGWSSFWWTCPLMMLAMVLAMIFGCRFLCSRLHDQGRRGG